MTILFKKINFIFLFLLSIIISGCTTDDPVLDPSQPSPNGGNSNSGNSNTEEETPYLTVDSSILKFDADGGETKMITVKSNNSYTVSTKAKWLDVSPVDGYWAVKASENELDVIREDSIVVSTASLRKVVRVQQAAKEIVYSLSVDRSQIDATASSSTTTIVITSNDSWTATSNASWIMLSASSGSGNKTITVSIAKNETSFERNEKIIITGKKSGIKNNVSVKQDYLKEGYTNGHMYVNLGLPSGTLWATCNVGALTPEDFGNYYAWGEISTKNKYSITNYKWSAAGYYDYNHFTKYTIEDGNTSGIWYEDDVFVGDNKTELDPSDDVAHIKWGEDWRMPTSEEFKELKAKCTWEWWCTDNYVLGCKFVGPNGNSIFLPNSGVFFESKIQDKLEGAYYWSSSLHKTFSADNLVLYMKNNWVTLRSDDRYIGGSIRPVRNPN